MSGRKLWTRRETNYLVKCLNKYGYAEGARAFLNRYDRTPKAIENKIKKLIKEGLIISTYSKRPWTEEDEKIVLTEVKNSPHNLSEAFRKAAEKTGRTEAAITQWFCNYRKKEGAKTCMITIGGRTKSSSNRKNIYKGTGGYTEKMTTSIWKSILKLLHIKY